jgi:hypothetical protein
MLSLAVLPWPWPGTVITSSVQPFQCAPQLLDFPLVGSLLALGLFKRFKNFFHFLECFSQVSDDLFDVLDGLVNRRAVLARGFLLRVALAGLVLLKSPRFVMRALMSRRALLLRWPFRHFARLNIRTRNLLAHVVLRGNIVRFVDGRIGDERLLFRARFVDIGMWRSRCFRLCRPFGWSSTSPASISSAPTPR